MKLSEIKSGMVIEVLDCGEVVRYLVADINGTLEMFNSESSLGSIHELLGDNLESKHSTIELLSVYKIINDDISIMEAIDDDDSLELLYTKEEDECDCPAIVELEKCIEGLCDVIDELREENETLRRAIAKVFQI